MADPLDRPVELVEAELATVLAEVSGRPVALDARSDADAGRAYLAAGLPEPYAEALVASGVARRDGWFETTTQAVRRLTGRAPTSLAEFLTAHRDELLAR